MNRFKEEMRKGFRPDWDAIGPYVPYKTTVTIGPLRRVTGTVSNMPNMLTLTCGHLTGQYKRSKHNKNFASCYECSAKLHARTVVTGRRRSWWLHV